MTKILLVEDDKSLREIYGVRLLAEGYDIVSAGDGEEALAVAIREKPTLIISDVMMPKISGFEMLDLLRNNEVTKDIKVIMMTALSGDQHRERGESLGADRYLVKSQVGIEDVVSTVHEILGDRSGEEAQAETEHTGTPFALPTTPQAPNQSPINPPEATSPNTVAGVPAPDLPSTPPNIPVVTTPEVPTTAAPASTPGITPIADTPVAPAAPVDVPDLPPVEPPEAVPTEKNPEAQATASETRTEEVSSPPADETPSFQPKDNSSNDYAQEKPYQPSVDLTQSGAHVATRVIQPIGEAVTPKVDVANLVANEEAKEILSQPTSPDSQPETPPAEPDPQEEVPEIQIDPSGAISIDSLPAIPSTPDQATFPNQ